MVMKSIVLLVLIAHSYALLRRRLNVAVVTDVHIGESCGGNLTIEHCKPVRALTNVVTHINAMKNIDAVFATGDLTASALRTEFEKFREIMDGLLVPWWPLLGNHDSWPYQRHSDGTFNQTTTPEGDQIFADIFGDILGSDKYKLKATTTLWPKKPCINGDFPQYESYFHNFVVTFPGFSSKLKFLNLDWVARQDALPEPGVGPQAELHDFEGGTLHWLDSTLQAQPKDSQFFVMQHHPFHNRFAFSPFGQNKILNFTFDDVQNKRVQSVLARSFPSSSFLGVHAGHMHRWFNGTAFTQYTALDESWLSLREWETPASKGWYIDEDYIASTQVFSFSVSDSEGDVNNDVVLENVLGLWEVPPDDEWKLRPVLDDP